MRIVLDWDRPNDPGALISVQELNGSRANPYDEYTGACRP